jgi:hypothetical protein
LPLLVAGLLVVFVGGLLITGSQPERDSRVVLPPVAEVFACSPGTDPDEPGPADQAKPFGWFDATFDRRTGKLVALANPGSTDPDFPIETWTFDVCTNTWTQMHPDHEPPAQVRGLVYDVDSDLTIGIYADGDREPYPYVGNVWTYDLETDTWTEKGRASTGLTFYDPVSGLIVGGDRVEELWDYDVDTDTWTPMRQTVPLRDAPGFSEYVYDASVDRIVEYAGGIESAGGIASQTWLIDLRTGTWSRSAAETPVVEMGWWAVPTVVYDEAAARTVVAGDFQWGAYDAAADEWEILVEAGPGEDPLPKPLLYDPVNERLIVADGGGGIGVEGDLLAYDLVTREWIVLLEPGPG